MAVLKIKDENNNFVNVPTIKGDKGDPGKDGSGIVELTSEDSSNPICLFDLDEGIYKIYGYIKYYPTYEGTAIIQSPSLISVAKNSTTTYVQILEASGNNVTGYEITKTSYKKQSKISELLDIFYPVGSYYETSDTSFNPNTSWGGTWVLENDGTSLVSKSEKDGSVFNVDLGTIVGSETHQLMQTELPGTTWATGGRTDFTLKKYFNNGSYYALNSNPDAILGAAHNIVQPSKVVNRWHRTA